MSKIPTLEVDGVQYDYKRRILEVLECQTCTSTFITEVATGMGKMFSDKEDSPLCPGCTEICRNVEILDQNGKRPN